jgi:2-aminoethylphosphonate aminotransferase
MELKDILPVRQVLLNPGPATTTDTVKLAQLGQDICPRDKAFGDQMFKICQDLAAFVGPITDYHTVLFGGSGTAGVEAMITSMVTKRLLIINNGAYGKRIGQICERYRIPYTYFDSNSIEPLSLDLLEEKIKSELQNGLSHLAIIHHETTSGLLNPLTEVGKLCKKYNLVYLVDAMSSYGAIPISMADSHIDALVSSSNKNIQGMAGVTFVIAHKNRLNELEKIEPRTYYLDLGDQYRSFQKTRQTRFTPPVQTLYALIQAIKETQEEGVENRYARYTKSWETLIQGMADLGLTYYVPKDHHSRIITAFEEPKGQGYDFEHMCDTLSKQHFTIYPGKLPSLPTFRIANIGAIDTSDIQAFLAALKVYLIDQKLI